MIFTQDWFTNNITNWHVWLDKYKHKPNLHFLEIGCYEGMATVWLVENVLTYPNSLITCIDNFQGDEDVKGDMAKNMFKTWKENVKPYEDKVFALQGQSEDLLRQIVKANYDFIYVDGSHKAVNVLQDLVLSFPLLKSKGIMIIDDYLWQEHSDPKLCPKLAIDAFLTIYEGQYELIAKEYQVALLKI